MPTMTDRLRDEQHFHDEQAAARRQGWAHDPALLRFADAAYLDHEPWVRPALAKLGPLAGKRILDFGCGHGMASTCLARAGAEVLAFDLSAGYVAEAVARATANGVSIQGFVADGARLPLADGSLDGIWGVAILHHLDMVEAAREIKRVLRPGGVAVFCEPWGGNPLLEAARHWLPYVGKERTADERPLIQSDVNQLRNIFPQLDVEYVQLVGMVRRAWRRNPLLPVLDRMDASLLRHWKVVRPWCRYVVLQMRKG
ncbi:MAG: class I SAM-dependent methyltransferase [Gemmatales bacterium]